MTDMTMRILTAAGVLEVETHDPGERSMVGTHWNAVRLFLDTGDDSALAGARGQTVSGEPLLTDPDEIEVWASAGELEFEDIYPSTGQ